jgi:hypothetical protein
MKSIGLVASAMTLLFAGTTLADSTALQGSWKGPWYIGMSSGLTEMDIAADGSGSVALTNLEEFGAKPVPLTKYSFDGKVFSFTAVGANGAALSMNLKLGQDGRQLRGNGKHAGFGARMELQRTD